jgi:kinetochore protein NNF1
METMQFAADALTNILQNEFESIIEARQVIPKLNHLETLISDASQRRKEAPSSVEEPTPYVLQIECLLSAVTAQATTAY